MQKKLLLVGIGGYAGTYLNPLLNGNYPDCEIVGCADPYPDACPRISEIRERNIPLYSDMKDFFDEGNTADLCIISSPIHFHTAQITTALKNGCNVLCEKPLCGDVGDLGVLLEAEESSGKYVGIGYQWSHSTAIQDLKRDILNGVYGKGEFLKSIVLWPRKKDYYTRGAGWAGKLRAKDGSLILDSVANNATAHYLHNMFYVLGDSINSSLEPTDIKAELYRANAIENYDTCKIDMTFENGAKALYIASHATDKTREPMFEYRFEKGTVIYEQGANGENIVGVFKDGTRKNYGNPFDGGLNKLNLALSAAENPGIKPVCSIKSACVHTKVIAEVQKAGIKDFPLNTVKENADGSAVYVEGLYDQLMQLYNNAK